MLILHSSTDKQCLRFAPISNVPSCHASTKCGQIIVPTGGGKTYIMIADAYKHLRDSGPQTIIVVAPRILLANQLCEEFMEHM